MRGILDRKGLLIGNTTVRVVISIIAIVIVFFVVQKAYSNAGAARERASADDLLKLVIARADSVPDGETMIFDEFQGVEGWHLVAWSSLDPVDDKPQKCFFKSCLCICEGGFGDYGDPLTINKVADNCQSTGICEPDDKRDIFLATARDIYTGGSKVIQARMIVMDGGLFELEAYKNETVISINPPIDLELVPFDIDNL